MEILGYIATVEGVYGFKNSRDVRSTSGANLLKIYCRRFLKICQHLWELLIFKYSKVVLSENVSSSNIGALREQESSIEIEPIPIR